MFIDLTKGTDVQRLPCGWIVETVKQLSDLIKANGILALSTQGSADVVGVFLFTLTPARDTPDITPDTVAGEIAQYYHRLIRDYPALADYRISALQFYGNLPAHLQALTNVQYKWDALPTPAN